MKKTKDSKPKNLLGDDLLPEYRFDYSKARPNRFAAKYKEDQVVVVLDPDVAEVFRTADEVNRALRAFMTAMPGVPH